MGYLYIAGCIVLTVAGQLILKWRVSLAGHLPPDPFAKLVFLLRLMFTPWMIAGFFAAFLAGLCWTAAMTKFELSYAYPFMSLAFVLVFLASVVLFGESVSWGKVAGLALIVAGIVVTSRS
jgi:multidrug transporter EmrE-like cation transporter